MTADDQRQPLSAGTETRAAFEAGLSHVRPPIRVPIEDGGEADIFVTTVPWGAEQVIFDPEPYEATPRSRRGAFTVQDVESLVAYTTRHSDPWTTTTWIDMDTREIRSLINDHGPRGLAGEAPLPQWGDHTAKLLLTLTPEWQHWTKRDGTLGSQTEFAEHIEDGVREIVTPDAATMLELAQTFSAHTDAQFRTATRLQSGQVNLRYDEETTARAGTNGEIEVPSTFVLGVAPFYGEPAWEVNARLRYRVSGGTLLIGYKLERPDAVLRDAMEQIADRLRGELETPVFLGSAPAAVDRYHRGRYG